MSFSLQYYNYNKQIIREWEAKFKTRNAIEKCCFEFVKYIEGFLMEIKAHRAL